MSRISISKGLKYREVITEDSGNKDNVILSLHFKLIFTQKIVYILKVHNVWHNWLWIIQMVWWNSVKCDVLSNPMHVWAAMIAKNNICQNSKIKVVKNNPDLFTRLHLQHNNWKQSYVTACGDQYHKIFSYW